MDAVSWGKVGTIVMSWVISQLLAGTIAFAVFTSIQKPVLNTNTPLVNAKKYVPVYLFMVGFIIALVTIKKGLKHVGLDVNGGMEFVYAAILGILIALLGVILTKRVKFDEKAEKPFHFANVEKIFAVLMIFTASAMAFAHGSNDVANAVGPMAAVISVAQSGTLTSSSVLPSWVLLVGGIGIVIGLATLGYKVIATVGKNITELTPTRGFSAEIAAASTVVLASYTGIPISTIKHW